MTDDSRQMTDPRETTPGPGSSKLAPEGNSKARLFVPGEGEEERQAPAAEESEGSQGGAPEQDAGKPADSDSPSQETQADTADDAPEKSEEQESKPAEPRGSRFLSPARMAAASGIVVGLAGALAARARARRRRTLLTKLPFYKQGRVFGGR